MPLQPPTTEKAFSRMTPQLSRIAVSISLLVASTVLLSACTSVALPPWVPGSQPATGAVGTTQPGAQQPSTAPGAPVSVEVSPVPPLAASVPTPAALPPPPPYSAAVAARFPAPSVVYSTPGLQPGRTTFTSMPEIRNWLRDQATAVSSVGGVKASVMPIGRSQQGEEIEALILTRGVATDPASLQATGRPTVLLIGQQHGDEPAGSEALLVMARELAQGRLRPVLDSVNVVIVPRANPDGGQAGARVTANGLDMNRDHLLLKTPEAQALAKLARDYGPAVVVDSHEYTVVGRFLEKFGAIQKYDALLQYATTPNLPEFLTKAAEEWYRRPMLSALSAQGLTTEWYYTTSSDLSDKKVSMGGIQADTGRNVNGLRNAISLLIETRGIGLGRVDIQRRVHAQVTAIGSALASTALRSAELGQLLPYVDKEVSAMACTAESVVDAEPTTSRYDLVMLDPMTGADKPVGVDWVSSLALRKLKARARPCGYLLGPDATTAVERLRMQGVQVQRIAESAAVLADRYIETSRNLGARQDVRGAIADNAPVTRVEVSLQRGLVDVARGAFYVPMNQPMGNLASAALEPDTQSSFFANSILPSLNSVSRVMTPPNIKVEELP